MARVLGTADTPDGWMDGLNQIKGALDCVIVGALLRPVVGELASLIETETSRTSG